MSDINMAVAIVSAHKSFSAMTPRDAAVVIMSTLIKDQRPACELAEEVVALANGVNEVVALRFGNGLRCNFGKNTLKAFVALAWELYRPPDEDGIWWRGDFESCPPLNKIREIAEILKAEHGVPERTPEWERY